MQGLDLFHYMFGSKISITTKLPLKQNRILRGRNRLDDLVKNGSHSRITQISPNDVALYKSIRTNATLMELAKQCNILDVSFYAHGNRMYKKMYAKFFNVN